tara:strand:+ start:1549 stop:1710 length:162 start_codon:yes stop_codon:yes gene_type:complete
MAIIKTIAVTLKDGSKAVINASDFDPAVHTLPSAPKQKPPVKKKIAYSSGVRN